MSELYDDEPFNDMPEEAQTGKDGRPSPSNEYVPPVRRAVPAPRPPERQQVVRQAAPVIEDPIEEEEQEEVDEDEENYDAALSDASLRLEQGSLYKLIMNHDLFSGVEADPKAVKNVQREIRKFAKEQMEVMLGMRQTTRGVGALLSEGEAIEFPFNALEVEILKQLASTATKGVSETADKYQAPKRTTLNPIAAKATKKVPKGLTPKASTPVKRAQRTHLDATIDQISRETGVPRELLEENQLASKSPYDMSPEELLEYNKKVTARRRSGQVQGQGGHPTLSNEQINQINETRSVEMANNPIWNKLIDTVKKLPVK